MYIHVYIHVLIRSHLVSHELFHILSRSSRSDQLDAARKLNNLVHIRPFNFGVQIETESFSQTTVKSDFELNLRGFFLRSSKTDEMCQCAYVVSLKRNWDITYHGSELHHPRLFILRFIMVFFPALS